MRVEQQLSLFLENKPAVLAAVCRDLGQHGINIEAITIANLVDHSVVRMMVSDPQAALHILGVPVVLGASRKGWIGALESWPPSERIGGSLAAALTGLDRGAQILRVHDVAQTGQAVQAWQRLNCTR